MSIQSSTASLQGLFNEWKAAEDALLKGQEFSHDYRNKKLKETSAAYQSRLQAALERLWGTIEQDSNEWGGFYLSNAGEIWQELEARQRAVTSAKNEAERANVPPHLELAIARAKREAADCRHLGQLKEMYATGSDDFRFVMQELAREILPQGRFDFDTVFFKVELKRDREARMMTPALQQALKAFGASLDAAAAAYDVTQKTINDSVMRGNYYAGHLMRYILFERRYDPTGPTTITVDRIRVTLGHREVLQFDGGAVVMD